MKNIGKFLTLARFFKNQINVVTRPLESEKTIRQSPKTTYLDIWVIFSYKP
jgi:hypothetical protein